jgi:hypothetical protein
MREGRMAIDWAFGSGNGKRSAEMGETSHGGNGMARLI